METGTKLLPSLHLAQHHGCWSFVTCISILANILVGMLAATEVVPIELPLVVVVVPGLMAWLRIATRVHQRTLYHLAVVAAIIQRTGNLKIIRLLHYHPLLHSRL